MADEADRAQAQMEEWQRVQELARLARQQSELQALALLECQTCGEDIGEERKQALPTTKLCVECAQAAELRLGFRR